MKSLVMGTVTAALLVVSGSAFAEVAVIRGVTAGPAQGAASSTENGTTIMRGSIADASKLVVDDRERRRGPNVRISAGDSRIWFYEPGERKLTVCVDRPTTKIDVRDLSCHSRLFDL